MKKYLKEQEIIEKLKAGGTLKRFTTFMKPWATSFKSKVTNQNYVSYSFTDGTHIHQMTAKSMIKRGVLIIDTGSYEKTIGGSKTTFVLKQ